jgi:methionine-rich copper-binding protein CopC
LALRPLPGLVLATAVAILAAQPAAAHSLLVASTPAAGAVVTTPPPYVRLRFNNRIEKRLSRVRLVDERGAVAAALIEARDADAADSVMAKLPPLAPGAWRVEWQVFSTDGHVVSGSYGFRLAR